MTKIAIVIGSIREGRNGVQVANWIKELADKHGNAEYSIIDLKEFNMPLMTKRFSEYTGEEAEYADLKKLADLTKEADGYIFVTPEYNHSLTAAQKNYFDLYYSEFNNKAAGIVSYGSAGGARSAEHVRGILAELQVADVRQHVTLSLFTDFENFSVFKPAPIHQDGLNTLLDQVVAWSDALAVLR